MRYFIIFFLFFWVHTAWAQFDTPLQGYVLLNGSPLENVHIENVSLHTATISDAEGKFTIQVSKGHRLHITHLAAREQFYIIAKTDIKNPQITIRLVEDLNALNEVTLIKDNRITVQSVGIIQGERKILTANERRLVTAGDFKPVDLLQLIYKGSTPLAPILNAINGRTKQIKKHIAVDKEISDYQNLYIYHGEFLANRLHLEDPEIQQFLDSLIGLAETPKMAQEKELDKTRIWLLDKHIAFKNK